MPRKDRVHIYVPLSTFHLPIDSLRDRIHVSGYRGTGVPGYRGTGVLGYRGTGVLGYRGTGVPGYWGTGVPGYWGTGVLGYWGTGVLGYSGTIELRYSYTDSNIVLQEAPKTTFLFKCRFGSHPAICDDLVKILDVRKYIGFVDRMNHANIALFTSGRYRVQTLMNKIERFNAARSLESEKLILEPMSAFDDLIMTIDKTEVNTVKDHGFYKDILDALQSSDTNKIEWESSTADTRLRNLTKKLQIDMVDAVPVAKSRDASADGGAPGAPSSSSLPKCPAAPGRAAPLVGRVLGEPRKVNGRPLSPIQRLAEAARRSDEAGAPSGVGAGRVKRVAHRIVSGEERRAEQGDPLVHELGHKRLRVEELERELEAAARKLRAQSRFSAHQIKCLERQSEERAKELEAAKRELGEMRSKYEAVRDELGEKINELDEKDGDARAARRLLERKDEELEQARHAVEELQQELEAAGHSSDRLAESNQALEELRREQALLHGHLSDTSANQAATLVRLAESHAHTTMAVQGNMRLMEIVGARLGAGPAV